MSHNSLGWLFQSTNRLEKAESAYAEALAIYKQLAADFPDRPEFRLGLAKSHHNLGNVLGAYRAGEGSGGGPRRGPGHREATR